MDTSTDTLFKRDDVTTFVINGKRVLHPELKIQRDKLRAENRCINGPRDPAMAAGRAQGVVHGDVVRGGKCQRCIDVHSGERAAVEG